MTCHNTRPCTIRLNIFTIGEKRAREQQLEAEERTAHTLNGEYPMGTSNKQGALSKQLETLERSKDENAAEIRRFGQGRLEIEYKLEKKSIDKRELTKELKEKRKTQNFFRTHLKKYKDNSLQRFGEEIIQLEYEIDDYMRDIDSNFFTKRPIGPVGRFIRASEEALNDEKLLDVIEIELGSAFLKSYICNCRKDRQKLENIMAKIWKKGKPPIIYTRKLSDIKYSENSLEKYSISRDLSRLIDYLHFEEPNVFNLVIDQKHVEQVSNQVNQNLKKKRTIKSNS